MQGDATDRAGGSGGESGREGHGHRACPSHGHQHTLPGRAYDLEVVKIIFINCAIRVWMCRFI